MIYEILENLDSLVAIITILISIYIFFNDPIRRWRFFGYRPTALVVLIDPNLNKVVIVNSSGSWSFCQGGIYNSDVYDTVEDVLKRELNLDPTSYKFFYSKLIGTADLTRNWQKNYPILGGFSFSTEIRGKAYLACIVMVDSKKIVELGFGVSEYKIVDKDEAEKIFLEEVSNKSKSNILKKALAEYPKAVDLWERTMGI